MHLFLPFFLNVFSVSALFGFPFHCFNCTPVCEHFSCVSPTCRHHFFSVALEVYYYDLLVFSFEIEEVGFAFHDDTSSQGPLCWFCVSILKAPEVVASIGKLLEKKEEIAVERMVE